MKMNGQLIPGNWRQLASVVLASMTMALVSCQRDVITLYVDPSSKTNQPGTLDRPFGSIEDAIQSIRSIISDQGMPRQGINVLIRGGIYPITETLQFSDLDGGTVDAPITWGAYRGEKVILTGGALVPEFGPISDDQMLERLTPAARESVVAADLHKLGIRGFGEMKKTGFGKDIQPTSLEVFYKGRPMTLARYPNDEWLKVSEVPQSGALQYQGDVANPGARFEGVPAGRHYGRFAIEDKRPTHWLPRDDIWMHGYWTWDWADMYDLVGGFDLNKMHIRLTEPYHQYGVRKGQRFYFRNVFEELDQPSEWYLDRDKGMLYFWPPKEIGPEDVLVSLLEEPMLLIEHSAYLHFENIIFEASRSTGVVVKGGHDIQFSGCTFRNLGNYAVRIEGGRHHRVQSCDIYEVGDGGIYVAGGDRRTLSEGSHQVDNCHIHHYSRLNRTGRPAITLLGVGNTLSHNYIHDAPHMGVWFQGNEHKLEYNEIHDVAQETGDVGAFYIGRDWTCRGNVIRYNYFHHLHGPGLHGVMAVYLDDWSSGTTIFGNVFYKSGRSAFIGGGRDNTIENNLFVGCEPSVHVDARGIGWASYYFDRTNEHFNTTLYDRMDAMNFREPPFSQKYPELLNIYNDEPALPKGNKIVHNVSVGGRWLDLYNGLDFDMVNIQNNVVADSILVKWTKENGGTTSIHPQTDQEVREILTKYNNLIVNENPGINDLKKPDLHMVGNSPAYLRGFKTIPIDEIGLKKDSYRNTK